MEKRYEIARMSTPPPPLSPLHEAPWRDAAVARIEWFHPDGSDHRPEVEFRALYDHAELIARYAVTDRFVRCIYTRFQDPVYKDSCCELFLQPGGTGGYFNIETNAIGALLGSWITDPTRTDTGFAGQAALPSRADHEIRRFTTLKGLIDPEIDRETRYEIEVRIPFVLLAQLSGALPPRSGDLWRGNIYKCSENSSRPHWGAWSPIGDRLDYHQPDRFGEFVFT